jgi:hypothetical protein
VASFLTPVWLARAWTHKRADLQDSKGKAWGEKGLEICYLRMWGGSGATAPDFLGALLYPLWAL